MKMCGVQVEFHECLSWALYGDERPVSRPGRFTPQERGHVPTEHEAEWRRGKSLPVQKSTPSMHLIQYTQLLKILQL
jgi:hypothetical protein